MTTELWVELIRVIPTVLWVVLVITLLVIFRTPLRARLAQLVGLKVGLSGVEATFITQEIKNAEAAARSEVPGAADDPAATPSERSLVARRAERNSDALRGARILWVDDNPKNNQPLENILSSLGVEIDPAPTTEAALRMITRHRYDLIITDMARQDDRRAGLHLIESLATQPNHPRVIIYASCPIHPLPEGAFGSTNRPDELLHLVFDVLERERS